jgi:hypothetical protein
MLEETQSPEERGDGQLCRVERSSEEEMGGDERPYQVGEGQKRPAAMGGSLNHRGKGLVESRTVSSTMRLKKSKVSGGDSESLRVETRIIFTDFGRRDSVAY